MAGPYYLAWVDEGETVFGPEHYQNLPEGDDEISEFEISQVEGEFAELSITIRSLGEEGPLSPERSMWAWLSYDTGDSDGVIPIFFGELIGVPTDIAGNKVTFIFRAAPFDVFEQMERIADTDLRQLPQYDPVFVDLANRNNADFALEGHAKRWHVDRVNHEVTVSHITQGEDGDEIFTLDDDVPHDSVKSDLSQAPLFEVGVDATVTWRQRDKGLVDFGSKTFLSYSGDGIVGDWPTPGSTMQGGWTVIGATAKDVYAIGSAFNASWSYQWQNKQKKHANGDTMSISISESSPVFSGNPPKLTGMLTFNQQTGVIDPFAKDENGDPAPLNIPASVQFTQIIVPMWQVTTTLLMQYNAERPRTERVMFVVSADLQEMTSTSLNPQEGEESIQLPNAEVGDPILVMHSWWTVRNTAVNEGDIVFPIYPGFPGLRVAQIVTVAGTTGEEHPEFSPIIGDLTVDGGVTWASLGPVTPDNSPRNWEKFKTITAGTIVAPSPGVVIPYAMLVTPGHLQFPAVGVAVNEGMVIQGGDGSYHICRFSGQTHSPSIGLGIELPEHYDGRNQFDHDNITISEPTWPQTWGVETEDGSVRWFSLGMTIPDSAHYHIATQGGTTGEFMPPFSNTEGDPTSDNTVVWRNIGAATPPVGGVPGETPRAYYFPSDRGRQSLEYLLCRATAKLLQAARAVKVTWDCSFQRALSFSCRKNALLIHPKLPGGQAYGKIIDYKIRGGGDGNMRGTVTIGCTVGKGNAVTLDPGEPTYVETGYVSSGYQRMEGQFVELPEVGNVGYSPPAVAVVDDGLLFPLTKEQVIEREVLHGTLAEQEEVIRVAIRAAQRQAQINQIQPSSRGQAITQQRNAAITGQLSVSAVLRNKPIWFEQTIKPVTDRSFAALYSIETTPLVAPRHIDLEAEV